MVSIFNKRISTTLKICLFLLVSLWISANAQYYDDDGRLIVSWLAPDWGNPVDHYIWNYTINGAIDSISGYSPASAGNDSSVILTNIGDWAIFNIRAVSADGDTSTMVMSDTAYYQDQSSTFPGDSDTGPLVAELSINIYPNPASNSSQVINWQISKPDYYRISVYDILGAKVAAVREGYMAQGIYKMQKNMPLAAGTYFAIISNPEFHKSIKFTVLH